jgi:hypothetical protein
VGGEFNKVVVSIGRPPLVALRFVISKIYSLLFGAADRRSATIHANQLAGDVRNNLPFLFTEYGAELIPTDSHRFPPPFDYALVTVGLSDLLFRFVRGRGSLSVQVAPRRSPSDLHDLSTVLNVIGTHDEIRRRPDFYDLQAVGKMLRPEMDHLRQVFSGDKYEELKNDLQDIQRSDIARTRQLEEEINRKYS